MEMHPFYRALDPFLIWFYRLTDHAWANLIIGTLVLAIIALAIGEFTSFLAFRVTRKHVDHRAEEAAKYQTLSMDALNAGNKEAYQAANKLANEAFGHAFFQQITLSAAFLWPAFFALAWMQYRFLNIEIPIPGTNLSLGFIGVFIIIYGVAYFILRRVQWFRRIKIIIEGSLTRARKVSGSAGVLPPAGPH